MQLSSSLCRLQETVQRDRAATATLANVRTVAERAAVAWGLEAKAAEKREARHLRTRDIAAAAIIEKQARIDDWDSLSENPDRELADA